MPRTQPKAPTGPSNPAPRHPYPLIDVLDHVHHIRHTQQAYEALELLVTPNACSDGGRVDLSHNHWCSLLGTLNRCMRQDIQAVADLARAHHQADL